MWVLFSMFDKVFENWVFEDVVASAFELFAVEDEVIGESSLPYGEFRFDASGESAFDVLKRF